MVCVQTLAKIRASRARLGREQGLGAAWNSAAIAAFCCPRISIPRRLHRRKWALIFAIVAIVAAVLGFGGIAGAAAGIAKFLFFLAVVGFLVFLALGVFAGRKLTGR